MLHFYAPLGMRRPLAKGPPVRYSYAMRFFIPLFLLFGLSAPLRAQLPDLDDLGRGLDLTPIVTPSPEPTPEAELLPAPADLHAGRAPAPPHELLPSEPDPATGLFRLNLPAGPRLIIPNPARLDNAWPLLHQSVAEATLKVIGPEFVVLHADGNFSAACPIERDEPKPLPLGADISPLEELPLVGIWAEIPEARRNHPTVLAAFQKLRSQLHAAGIQPDTREFYFFPTEEGRVFFALRLSE